MALRQLAKAAFFYLIIMVSFENYYLRSSKFLNKNCITITENKWQRYKQLEQKQEYWWQ